MPPSRGTRDRTRVSCGSCTAGGFFTTQPPGKPETPWHEGDSTSTLSSLSGSATPCHHIVPVHFLDASLLHRSLTHPPMLHPPRENRQARPPGSRVSPRGELGCRFPLTDQCWQDL